MTTSTAPAATSDSYFRSLEALRGIGALAIVAYHLNDQLGYRFGFDHFYLGVDLFFVLSGFIIFHAYGDRIADGTAYARFMWLRFARLYPLHIATLLAFVAFQAAVQALGGDLSAAIEALFRRNDTRAFIANLALVHGLNLFAGATFNIPSWSISTEFYTYALFGVLFWLGVIRPERPFVVPALIALAGGVALATQTSTIHVMHDWGFVRNLIGFSLGVMARGLYGRLAPPPAGALTGVQLAAAFLLLVLIAVPVRVAPFATFAAPLLFAILIVACSYDLGGFCPVLRAAPLQWLGRISYSLYMTHYMVVLLASGLHRTVLRDVTIVGSTWIAWALLPIVIALSLAIAHVTYTFIEVPSRAFLRGLWPPARLRRHSPPP